jgi:hypothetical protein
MLRKAKAGYVTGGHVFGYDIVAVNSHKERRRNEAEAKVVRRGGELYAAGAGYSTIASILNAESALTPRSWKDASSKWSAGSVREMINRPLYRGEIIYGRTKKRNLEGAIDPTNRPSSEWAETAFFSQHPPPDAMSVSFTTVYVVDVVAEGGRALAMLIGGLAGARHEHVLVPVERRAS